MKQSLAIFSMILAVTMVSPARADEQPGGSAMERAKIVLDKVKADKKFITSKNLSLTDAESDQFWPLYDEYQQNLESLNMRIAKLILNYAEAYRNKSMTDELAGKLLQESLAIDAEELAMKQAFVPKLQRVLPGVKAARYMQIENKLRAMVRFKLADEVPLIE